MKNCPLNGNPCPEDKVFTIGENVREYTWTTNCCRNCAPEYIRLRNEAATSEANQLAEVEEFQDDLPPEPPAASPHQGIADFLNLLGLDVTLIQKPITIEKIGTVKPAQDKQCPRCGCSIHDLRKMKKMGCPHCYVTFAEEIDNLLPKVQAGKKTHVGKTADAPQSEVKLPAKMNDLVAILREQMAQAITEEDYEKAAKCRDLIKKYGGDVAES